MEVGKFYESPTQYIFCVAKVWEDNNLVFYCIGIDKIDYLMYPFRVPNKKAFEELVVSLPAITLKYVEYMSELIKKEISLNTQLKTLVLQRDMLQSTIESISHKNSVDLKKNQLLTSVELWNMLVTKIDTELKVTISTTEVDIYKPILKGILDKEQLPFHHEEVTKDRYVVVGDLSADGIKRTLDGYMKFMYTPPKITGLTVESNYYVGDDPFTGPHIGLKLTIVANEDFKESLLIGMQESILNLIDEIESIVIKNYDG